VFVESGKSKIFISILNFYLDILVFTVTCGFLELTTYCTTMSYKLGLKQHPIYVILQYFGLKTSLFKFGYQEILLHLKDVLQFLLAIH